MQKLKKSALAIILHLLFIMPGSLHATSIGAGFYTWYSWWDPAWTKGNDITQPEMTVHPNFLYGPGITLSLPKNFTITSMFLYGSFFIEGEGFVELLGAQNERKYTVRRFDSDTTISYSFTRFFKIFLGFKYMHFSYDQRETAITTTLIIYANPKITYNEYAPALGIAFTIRLIDSFYLLINSAGLYNFSYQERSGNLYGYDTVPVSETYYIPISETIYLNKIGINANMAFAYYIEKINITVSIGGRYQMYKALTSKQNKQYDYLDQFYGVTASIHYNFNFKGGG